MRPLRDKLIVRPLEGPNVTAGGLIIPDTAKEPIYQGIVMSVGDGWSCPHCEGRLEMDVKPGDRVLYAKYAKSRIEVDGEELYALRYEHVYAVLEG
jgi:chaperonin GroES